MRSPPAGGCWRTGRVQAQVELGVQRAEGAGRQLTGIRPCDGRWPRVVIAAHSRLQRATVAARTRRRGRPARAARQCCQRLPSRPGGTPTNPGHRPRPDGACGSVRKPALPGVTGPQDKALACGNAHWLRLLALLHIRSDPSLVRPAASSRSRFPQARPVLVSGRSCRVQPVRLRTC